MPQKDLIAIEITNNSSLPIDVTILQQNLKEKDSDAKNLYEYDMTNAEYDVAFEIGLNYYLSSEPLKLLTKTALVLQQNIYGVLDALNSMGIGNFFVDGTTIYVYNDFYIYSTLAFI